MSKWFTILFKQSEENLRELNIETIVVVKDQDMIPLKEIPPFELRHWFEEMIECLKYRIEEYEDVEKEGD